MDHRLRQHLVRKLTLKKNSKKNSKSDVVKASNNIFGVVPDLNQLKILEEDDKLNRSFSKLNIFSHKRRKNSGNWKAKMSNETCACYK